MGNHDAPEKVLVWFHGATQTGFLDRSIFDGLDMNKVIVVQPINKDPLYYGTTPKNLLDPFSIAICLTNSMLGALQVGVPDWLRPWVPNFNSGFQDACNIDWKNPVDYHKKVDIAGNILRALDIIKKGVVVGGYSQGGTVAVDAALRWQDKAVGSIVIVASTTFDNSGSMGGSKDFSGTRYRFIAGKDDIWFPPGPSARSLERMVSKYKLSKVGSWPETL